MTARTKVHRVWVERVSLLDQRGYPRDHNHRTGCTCGYRSFPHPWSERAALERAHLRAAGVRHIPRIGGYT